MPKFIIFLLVIVHAPQAQRAATNQRNVNPK